MDSALRDFEKRQKAVRRKHARMARGYRNRMDRSGIIIQTPDNKAPGIALRVLFLTLIGFFCFKAFLLAGLGETRYLDNIALLSLGNGFERAGAIAMQVDPATAFLAERLAPLLN